VTGVQTCALPIWEPAAGSPPKKISQAKSLIGGARRTSKALYVKAQFLTQAKQLIAEFWVSNISFSLSQVIKKHI
jgi:hypothetical protein